MRRILIIAIIATAFQASAQLSVGIRNNRFLNVAYLYKEHYSARLEQSVFSESLGLQYMRGYAGYQTEVGIFRIKGTAYFGATFNRMYYSTGALAEVRCVPYGRMIIDAKLNPHYDSGYGYTTCYYGGIGAVLSDNIDIIAGFTNIPEYRMPERRLNVGFDFHVKNLRVAPKLSLNVSRNSGPKSLRPIIDFEYTFQRNKNNE